MRGSATSPKLANKTTSGRNNFNKTYKINP
jgi:hypothetical protein